MRTRSSSDVCISAGPRHTTSSCHEVRRPVTIITIITIILLWFCYYHYYYWIVFVLLLLLFVLLLLFRHDSQYPQPQNLARPLVREAHTRAQPRFPFQVRGACCDFAPHPFVHTARRYSLFNDDTGHGSPLGAKKPASRDRWRFARH